MLFECAGGASAATSPSPAAREKTASQKMLHRLNTVFESGKVMPVAFLPASRSAPLALLDLSPGCEAAATAAAVNGNANPALVTGGAPAAGAVGEDAGNGASALSQSALRLVSDLAVDSLLAGVPQQMRDNYMKQVRARGLDSGY